MENSAIKQQFSSYLFWDVGEMDWEVHRNIIVARVMDRGTRGDVRRVWDHYGAEAVKAALLQAPALQRKTISFFANQFHLRHEDFRTYRKCREMGTWIR